MGIEYEVTYQPKIPSDHCSALSRPRIELEAVVRETSELTYTAGTSSVLSIKAVSVKCFNEEGPRFDPLRLSFLFKNCGLWTLSCDFARTIKETSKWLTQLPTLMQNHSGGDSVTSRY